MLRKFLPVTAAVMITLIGCAPELKPPTHICPGKQSSVQSLASLKSNLENIVSLKATGRCNARFYVEGKKYKESFPVTVWLNPPAQIRLHGDLFLNPRGIVLGSNEREFWLAIKPKEISTYQWGLWSEQNSPETLMLNPKTLLEAFGIVTADEGEGWSLSNKGPFDVLTRRNIQGRIIKKVYIYNCNYQVFKIEYFNPNGKVVVATELHKYKEFYKGFFVPRIIKITTNTEKGCEDSVTIYLNSVKQDKFDREKQNIYFNPRKPKGFKHIYKIINGNMIEQSP